MQILVYFTTTFLAWSVINYFYRHYLRLCFSGEVITVFYLILFVILFTYQVFKRGV